MLISLYREKLPTSHCTDPSRAVRARSGRCSVSQRHDCYFKALMPQVSTSAGKLLLLVGGFEQQALPFFCLSCPSSCLGVAQRRRSKVRGLRLTSAAAQLCAASSKRHTQPSSFLTFLIHIRESIHSVLVILLSKLFQFLLLFPC